MEGMTWKAVVTVLVLALVAPLVLGEETSDDEALKQAGEVKDEIEKKLGIKLASGESEHFMIISDTPAFESGKALKAAEAVYKKLSGIFHMRKGTKLWPGKFVIVLFKDRQEYTDYWYKVRNHRGRLSGSQGTSFGRGLIGYVANSTPGHCSNQTGSVYFYLSGCFLNGYKAGKTLPPWLSTGFTIYCCTVLTRDTDGVNRSRRDVKGNIERGDRRSFQVIRETKSWPSTDGMGRGLCFSLVDYMISLSQRKFVAFVERLKEGATEEEAIQDVFGMTLAEFEDGWFAFIERKY